MSVETVSEIVGEDSYLEGDVAGGQPTCAERPLRDALRVRPVTDNDTRAAKNSGSSSTRRSAAAPSSTTSLATLPEDDVVQAARPTDQATLAHRARSTAKISRASWASTTSRDAPTPAGNTTSAVSSPATPSSSLSAHELFPPRPDGRVETTRSKTRPERRTSPTRSSPFRIAVMHSLGRWPRLPRSSVLPAAMVTHPRTEGEGCGSSANDPAGDTNWSAVIARCLAYLCLKNSEYREESVLEQAAFLENLGLPVNDRAGVVGSTPASLRELARRARHKKGGKRSGKGKHRR